ncbi:hypothetical protein [Cupriavidus basilensis]|uniref:hypothetical protein n=1 Tax=Cupriavidus basilensis TaxID=68895 RepID=UPI000750C907|nr:hypothetical protein [Cupriavidus basilensis]
MNAAPHARPLRLAACLAPLLLAAACQSGPPQPKVTPLDYTVRLGHISEKTAAGTVDAPGTGAFGSAVGMGAAGGNGWGGGGMSMGFAVNLNQLLNPQPRPQIELYQYKVTALDGSPLATVSGPAAPGLDAGACVRMIYPDDGTAPRIVPSAEC